MPWCGAWPSRVTGPSHWLTNLPVPAHRVRRYWPAVTTTDSRRRSPPVTVEPVVRKALLVLLVVVVVATGLPIILGMSGIAACPDCGPALTIGTGCTLAVLVAGIALVLAMVGRRHRLDEQIVRLSLHSFLLERPPRLA